MAPFARFLVTQLLRIPPLVRRRRLRNRMVPLEDEHRQGDIGTVEVEARTGATTEAEHLNQCDVVARPDPPPARG